MRHVLLPLLSILTLLLAACDGGGGGTVDPCAGVTPECTSDAACNPGASCDECGRCIGGGCAIDTDCGGGQVCTAGTCTTPTGCTGNDDCGEGEVCEAGACVAGDCTEVGCPSGLRCRTEDALCVECMGNNHCIDGARPWCELDSGTCVGCRGDGDCDYDPDRTRCTEALTCVQCLSNDDCDFPTPKCREDVGVCGTCSTDADCPGSFCREDATCDLGPEEGEACAAGGACAPGFACVGATCRTVCDLYASDCPAGKACTAVAREGRVVMNDDGSPVAACVDASTGAGLDQPCSSTTGCAAGLFCLPESATESSCKPFCNPDGTGASCGGGDECIALSLGENGEAVGVCSTPSSWFDACTTDLDCDAGQGCAPSYEDGVLIGRCVFTTGTGTALSPCDDDADCRSDFCVPFESGSSAGFCFGGCDTDAACNGEGFCSEYLFTVGVRTVPMNGCRAGCLSDDECAEYPGAICGIGVIEEQLVGICTMPDGAAGPGDFCTSDAACGTGICFDNGVVGHPADEGFCLGPCGSDVDCGPDTACRLTALNIGTSTAPRYDTMEICWGLECTGDASCPEGWACGFDAEPADPANDLRPSCFPAYGAGLAGTSCTTDLDCRTNQCRSWGVDTICLGPCRTDADCTAEGTVCELVMFTNTGLLGVCAPL